MREGLYKVRFFIAVKTLSTLKESYIKELKVLQLILYVAKHFEMEDSISPAHFII